MGILDNSGDIILDAVLTDTGRERLAKGDGSFRVVKFALGDDEIDYGLYNSSHVSGSSYYDQDIMQTLVFEAFTNNASVMNSKLITNPRANLLYLPVLKINENLTPRNSGDNLWIVASNADTFTDEFSTPGNTVGVLSPDSVGNHIRVDQGLDTTEIPPAFGIGDLIETQYVIRIDNRFGKIVSRFGKMANVSFIDDDNIATYFLNLGSDTLFVQSNGVTSVDSNQTISGPRGTILSFAIQPTLDLRQSNFLFTQLGSTKTYVNASYIIDTVVRVEGLTTGSRVDIPIRFVKQQ